MTKLEATALPEGSLLAKFGAREAYRDCFRREEPGHIALEQFVERFYCSPAFRPERLLLGLIGKGASNVDAQLLAKGATQRFAAWSVVERTGTEILLQDFRGTTASWLCVRPLEGSTELLFGSWVGEPDRGVVKALMPFHRWYSRVLLGGFA